MKRLVKFGILFLVLAISFAGCEKQGDELFKSKNGIVLYEKTHIINDAENSGIILVDSDKVIFQQKALPSDVNVGSIIVSGITDKAPVGYLRRVVSVQNNGGQIVLNTEPADLTDAIKSGSFSLNKDISVENNPSNSALLRSFSFGDNWDIFSIKLDGVVGNDAVKLQGTTGSNITFHLDITFDNGLSYLKTGIAISNTADLNLTATMQTPSLPSDLRNGITIEQLQLPPLQFEIGPVPVVITNSAELVAGLDANAKLQFQTGFEATDTIDASIVYNKGEGFNPEYTIDKQFEYTPFNLQFEGSAEPFCGFYWKANLYGIGAAHLEFGPKVSTPIEGKWDKGEAYLKMDLNISMHMLANLFKLSYDQNWPLYETTIFNNPLDYDGAPSVDENGLTDSINNIVPPDILQNLEDLGIAINGGNTPPNIEGTYLANPLVLVKNNTSMNIAEQWDMYITFGNQNNSALTIDANYTMQADGGWIYGQTTMSSSGTGSFIVGKDNKFSVFVDARRTELNYTAKTVEVFSGEITTTGIKNLQWAVIMVDDGGDPLGLWIGNGEGYMKKDSDGFSERINQNNAPALKKSTHTTISSTKILKM